MPNALLAAPAGSAALIRMRLVATDVNFGRDRLRRVPAHFVALSGRDAGASLQRVRG